MQLTSRAIGEHIYHPSCGHAALRNSIRSAKSDADCYDMTAWLYGSYGLGDDLAEARAA